MATFNLTAGDDVFSGTEDADTFDGYTNGKNGGKDQLTGAGGDDTFLFASRYTGPQSGTLDGGGGTDTVVAYGDAIGSLSFQNVEALKIDSALNTFSASISQLNAFSSIENTRNSDDLLYFFLIGEGGNVNLSSVWKGKPVNLNLEGITSAATITATNGNDYIGDPGYFSNTVDAGDGDDVLSVGSANQHTVHTLKGGKGDDLFYLGSGHYKVDGGDGVDTLMAADITHFEIKNVEFLALGDSINIKSSQFHEIEEIKLVYPAETNLVRFNFRGEGGVVDLSHDLGKARIRAYCDHMTSGIVLTATKFNDLLRGSKFDDVMNAGKGNDLIICSEGSDIINGQGGDDIFHLYPNGRGQIDGGDGLDSVYLYEHTVPPHGAPYDMGSIKFSNVEKLFCNDHVKATIGQLSQFDSIIFIDNDSEDDLSFLFELHGKGGAIDFSRHLTELAVSTKDVGLTSAVDITGTSGNDELAGSRFADLLYGGRGNDALDGGDGYDRLVGGKGDDAYGVDSKHDQVFEKVGEGWDYVASAVSYDLARDCKGQEVEGLLLAGNAMIEADGNELDNILQGNAASNALKGGKGDDYFLFSTLLDAKKNVDIILDFDRDDDLIFLNKSVFRSLRQDDGRYLSDKYFHDMSDGKAGRYDRILYDPKDGSVFYDPDGTGTRYLPIKFAEIADHPKLSAEDFAVF